MLRFLKGHYKHRSRSGETYARIDMQGEGGIIADGYLKFTEGEEQSFLSTFEATSFESREELFYVPRNRKLNWDSWSLALLFTAACLIVAHSKKFYPVLEYNFFLTVIGGGIITVAFYFIYKYLFRTFSIGRYRYIYAVEQFKKYFADEQWIAFGEDVFPNQDDKYFKELKRQCLKLGIGLIIVNRNLNCRFVATPSIENVSMGSRSNIQFQRSSSVQSRTSKMFSSFGSMLSFWNNPSQTVDLFRFKKVPVHQFTMVSLSLVIIAGLLFYELINGPVRVISDQNAYNAELARKAKNAKKETSYYIVDTSLEPGEFDVIREDAEKEVETILATRKSTDIIISGAKKDALLFYDCARFENYSGKYYIIQDTVLFSFEETVERINKLREYSMDATAIWRGCFRGYGTGYLIYFDQIFQDSTSKKAELEASYVKTFFRSGRIESEAKVTMIEIK